MWKEISNSNESSIFFAETGTPSQRGLNENSNGILRRKGLPKKLDFYQVNQNFVSAVASKRNHIPRKSLNYRTTLEVFLSYVNEEQLSSLNWQIIGLFMGHVYTTEI
ncbi:transposase [Brochothrix campestris FSL F6-1037]|uniref:Transposase n=1 Tax=Brochothrix campestris FSL F6-1037 TaxID=1265861 RepID=W7D0A4_9LIST|nr:transposase [Brochothrix campestris FSL F6-1037]